MSERRYFTGVAFATLLAFWCVTLLNPPLGHAVRQLLGLEAEHPTTPDSFYAERVSPILEEHCTQCHGERRDKGKLRLDSLAALMRGGKHGDVVKARSLQDSELYQRITLPPSSSKTMPPGDRAPLSAQDVTVLKLWITEGASGSVRTADIKGVPPPTPRVVFTEIDYAEVEKERAPLEAAVARLSADYPSIISYESRDSAYLELNAALLGSAFGDTDFLKFAIVSDHIVRADLSGTSVTDQSKDVLASMTKLRVVRLTDTAVTGITIDALLSLRNLRSVAAPQTAITDAASDILRQKGIAMYDGEGRERAAPRPMAQR